MTLNSNYYYIPHIQEQKTNQVDIWKTFLKDPVDLLEMKTIKSEIKNKHYGFNKLHTGK